jgi:hypothetical protein
MRPGRYPYRRQWPERYLCSGAWGREEFEEFEEFKERK